MKPYDHIFHIELLDYKVIFKFQTDLKRILKLLGVDHYIPIYLGDFPLTLNFPCRANRWVRRPTPARQGRNTSKRSRP